MPFTKGDPATLEAARKAHEVVRQKGIDEIQRIQRFEHMTNNREVVREHYSARVSRISDELDKLIKLITWTRECLENEMFEGLGYRQTGVQKDATKRLLDLASALNSAVNTKIRFDKAEKDMLTAMSPEEEFESVCAYVATMDRPTFERLRQRMKDYSAKLKERDAVKALEGGFAKAENTVEVQDGEGADPSD